MGIIKIVDFFAMISSTLNEIGALLLHKKFGEGEHKRWAQTPPMGWDSGGYYGPFVREREVKSKADYIAKYLKKYGWEYIILDIGWFIENDTHGSQFVIDEYGRYLPALNRFPSSQNGKGFKQLAQYIHKKGLKFGIHIKRGVPNVAVERNVKIKGSTLTVNKILAISSLSESFKESYLLDVFNPGAQDYYNSVFDLYAEWGVDFVQVDDSLSPYSNFDEIKLIRNAIDQCGRKIVLSTSIGETSLRNGENVFNHINIWKLVDGVSDDWGHVKTLINLLLFRKPVYSTGTWVDCGRIPIDCIAIQGKVRNSRLLINEQYSLMTLLCILRSSLFLGGDMPSNDRFTLSLLTNSGVLRVHKFGSQLKVLFSNEGILAISSTDSKNGDIYLALFNLTDDKNVKEVKIDFELIGTKTRYEVADLWMNDKPIICESFIFRYLPFHGCSLVKLKTY